MSDASEYYRLKSYGMRKDGTIGGEEPGNPVAVAAILDEKSGAVEGFVWTDGTEGPLVRKNDMK